MPGDQDDCAPTFGFTQEQLSEAAEIDRSYLQRIDSGSSSPTMDVALRVKQALKCTWDQLFEDLDRRQPPRKKAPLPFTLRPTALVADSDHPRIHATDLLPLLCKSLIYSILTASGGGRTHNLWLRRPTTNRA